MEAEEKGEEEAQKASVADGQQEETLAPADQPTDDQKPKATNDLDAEISQLKQQSDKIWFNFDTGTPGIVFIKLLDCFKGLLDINRLAAYVIANASSAEPDGTQSRFICRFLPISCLCKASGNIGELNRLIKPVI